MYCPLGSTLWRTRYHYHRGTGARRSAGEPTSPNYCSPHTIICGGGKGKPTILENVDFVYVRCGPLGISLSPVYSGCILSRHGKVYELQMGDKIMMVTADHLKPHTGPHP